MHWIPLKYTTNTMKYTINTPKCIEKYSNTLVSFKIHLFTIKNTFLYFNTHWNTFQIHCNTFITHLSCTLNHHCYTLICFHIHWKCLETYLFCTSLSCHYTIFQNCYGASLFYQNVMHLPWMFIGIQKSSIFHEFHTSYWLIKYLNLKLISWDTINTCW
jgi:hypothetical protein